MSRGYVCEKQCGKLLLKISFYKYENMNSVCGWIIGIISINFGGAATGSQVLGDALLPNTLIGFRIPHLSAYPKPEVFKFLTLAFPEGTEPVASF